MAREPANSFAENIASGLRGITLRTTVFLYLLAVLIVGSASILIGRVLGQRTPPYLIPLLVSSFAVVAYLYSWKLIFKRGPKHLLTYVGLISAIIYLAYRLPAGFVDHGWLHFDLVRRAALWLVRGTVFRSLIAPLVLFIVYAAVYFWRIRWQRFIVVSDFRVWGNLERKNPAKGIADRLQDELMRLLSEMGSSETDFPFETARATATPGLEKDEVEAHPPLRGGFAPPPTQVTLQYEGVSFEGLNTFIRRKTGREVVVTGDLLAHPNGFLLVARTERDGPWEVLIPGLDSVSVGIGLRKMALRIVTTLAQGFLPRNADNFVFLQTRAEELGEFNLLVRLAKLAKNTISLGTFSSRDETKAQELLALAYFNRGTWHLENSRLEAAKKDFTEAKDWYPDYLDAWEKLAEVYDKLKLTEEAGGARQEAERIKRQSP